MGRAKKKKRPEIPWLSEETIYWGPIEYKIETLFISNEDLHEKLITLLRERKLNTSFTLNEDESNFNMRGPLTNRYSAGEHIPHENLLELLSIDIPEGCIGWNGMDKDDGIEIEFVMGPKT